jgi:hypothetical protein
LTRLPSLRELSLDNTSITDAGIASLRAISTLRSLDLYHTRVTKSGYEALQASLPQCRIFYDEQSGVAPRLAGRQ